MILLITLFYLIFTPMLFCVGLSLAVAHLMGYFTLWTVFTLVWLVAGIFLCGELESRREHS